MPEYEKEVKHSNERTSIRRGRHTKEQPYVRIQNSLLRDKSISPKAKGVLCYMLHLPDNWETHPKQVAFSMGVSVDQIYTVLKELIKNGYAIKHVFKNKKGQFDTVRYDFFEEKLSEEEVIKEISTVTGSPCLENPETETPPILKTNSNNKELEKQPPQPPKSEPKKTSPKPKKTEGGGGVFFNHPMKRFENLNAEFIQLMKDLFPDIAVETELRHMVAWLLNPDNPKRTGNQAFITNWLKRASERKKQNPLINHPKPIDDVEEMPYDPEFEEFVKKNQLKHKIVSELEDEG